MLNIRLSMLKPRMMRFGVVLFITWAMVSVRLFIPRIYAASSPSLGSAASYSIIAGTTVTNSGSTTISDDIGISPGSSPPTDYIENGSSAVSGTTHDGDAAAATAQTDTGTAYTALAGQSCDTDYGAVTTDLAGKNLTPGVYCSDAFSLTGTLTLDGGPTDVWIFKSAGDVTTTGASATVVFSGGGNPCNVWWYVPGSVTIDAGSSLVGTVIANTDISLASGATLNGRSLAMSGSVTLDGVTISGPTCTIPVSQSSPSGGGSSSGGQGGSPSCTPSDITTVPKIIETKRTGATSVALKWGPYAGLNSFIIAYGPTSYNWLYNTKVTGFDTTINALPPNQPVWIKVAATDNCAVGSYSDPVQAGKAPLLPNTGLGPPEPFPWAIPLSVGLLTSSIVFVFLQVKRLVGFKRK